eukprot:TRINITY_DN34906_c0_g1_i1.p1 TRINITY_DN34906_c0_g1~~TRINITY_DN34906_c0_g1_i1.p1  ORF type:complete len:298 (+),score=101.84 TRINITY_DN34906_c0_g1_i1:222-1115(+)
MSVVLKRALLPCCRFAGGGVLSAGSTMQGRGYALLLQRRMFKSQPGGKGAGGNKAGGEEEELYGSVEEFQRARQNRAESEEVQKDREGALRLLQLGIILVTAPLAYWYFKSEKNKEKNAAAQISEVRKTGVADVGGNWTLVDFDGVPRTRADFYGTFPIMYFGFTHCPEICPVELHRMSRVTDALRAAFPDKKFTPLFVSCDPKRDCLKEVKSYLSEFHKDFIGLVGTHEQVADICKSHRIYFSSPSAVEEDEGDYLIDHSIAIYFFDQNFDFVEAFGSRFNETEIVQSMRKEFARY